MRNVLLLIFLPFCGFGQGIFQSFPNPTSLIGGDVDGTLGNMVVKKINQIPVSATNPTTGQVFVFDGTTWVPNSVSAASEATTVTNTATISNSGTLPNLQLNVNLASITPDKLSQTYLTSFTEVDGSVTNENQTVSAGTGISVVQTGQNFAVTNSSPDQTVMITGATGTYPNFTLPAAPVTSVNTQTGAVVLTKSDVGLSNVPNADATLRANHTGTQLAATVSNFQATVSANTDVVANTAARHTHANLAVLDATTASYLTAEQTKLSGIATGAEVNVNADWNAATGDAQILNKPTIANEATTVTTTATISNSGTLPDLQLNVVDGSITPAKLSQTYLTSEVDGSVSNELQTLSIAGQDITLSNGGGTVTVPSAVTTVGGIGTGNANGATITGNTINLQAATISTGGLLTSGSQSIGGDKQFNGQTSFTTGTVPSTPIFSIANTAITTFVYASNGSPEGVVTANTGSFCFDGSALGRVYSKQTGAGNTEWSEISRPKVSVFTTLASQDFATTAPAAATSLTASVVSGKKYTFDAFLLYSTNLATNGLGVSYVTASGFSGTVFLETTIKTTAAGASVYNATTNATTIQALSAPVATGNVVRISGVIECSVSGTFAIAIASESGVSPNKITLDINSKMYLQEIN